MPLISKHFGYTDFACHTGEPYPVEWIDERLQPLCDVLDAIRDKWGGPVIVVCGYRTPAYNELLRSRSSGVAANSQHPQGRAADVRPLDGSKANVARFCAVIDRMIQQGELSALGGFGRYPGWAHVDVRQKVPDGHVARWDGAGYGSEPT